MSDNSPYGSRLGVGGRHNQIKQGIFDRKKEQALKMLGQTDYFDDKKIKLDDIRNISIKSTIIISCLILSLYFISPSIINSLLDGLFI